MSLLTYLTPNCTFQSLNHSVCVCVYLLLMFQPLTVDPFVVCLLDRCTSPFFGKLCTGQEERGQSMRLAALTWIAVSLLDSRSRWNGLVIFRRLLSLPCETS